MTFLTSSWRVLHDDCLNVLRALPDNSVDSVVTDPPAGIEFMGKEWDTFKGDSRQPGDDTFTIGSGPFGRAKVRHGTTPGYKNQDARSTFIATLMAIFAECRRVLKPGGHALIWAIPRTSHWTATAIEDAGFEVRDVVTHLFGSGFPKSLDVGKAIDKAAGLLKHEGKNFRTDGGVGTASYRATVDPRYYVKPAPATNDAAAWSGWGTALKPAAEHWILARKPINGTVAANVLEHGTGALNIDGCRIGTNGERFHTPQSDPAKRRSGNAVQPGAGTDAERMQAAQRASIERTSTLGRWPANVVLSHLPECAEACAPGCAVAMLDEQSGVAKPSPRVAGRMGGSRTGLGMGRGGDATGVWPADPGGGASRFFYVAKAPKKDKTAGGTVENAHPTVKNTELMRWLVRLITPSGGLVLDPFTGSGSTGVACAADGFRFLGVERDDGYINTAISRIEHAYGESMIDNNDDDDGTQLRPFIRWVGGKRTQAPAIAAWCAERLARTRGARYIEPFLGGGAVALALPPGAPMILADLCQPLGWLWWWVQQEPVAVAEYAAGFGGDLDEGWNTAEGFAQARRDHNEQPFAEDDYTPSARFLWLLHAAYNGLYRENAAGQFNVPWGKRSRVAVPTAAHLLAVAGRLATAEIRPGWDFEDVIADARTGDVIFADPPYDGAVEAFTSYTAAPFTAAEQIRLSNALAGAVERGVHVISTNADTPRVRELYGWMTIEAIDEARSVAPTANGRGNAACVRMTASTAAQR